MEDLDLTLGLPHKNLLNWEKMDGANKSYQKI